MPTATTGVPPVHWHLGSGIPLPSGLAPLKLTQCPAFSESLEMAAFGARSPSSCLVTMLLSAVAASATGTLNSTAICEMVSAAVNDNVLKGLYEIDGSDFAAGDYEIGDGGGDMYDGGNISSCLRQTPPPCQRSSAAAEQERGCFNTRSSSDRALNLNGS